MNSTRLSLLSSGENSQRGKALFMVSIQNYDLILSNMFYTKSMFNQNQTSYGNYLYTLHF